MTMKPFAIQGADLTLGGVNLQAGTTGVVIPGVTRATNYVPEEVNDSGDQTHVFTTTPIVIDHTYYSILNGDYSPSGYTEAEYAVTDLDGEGYIDGIDIVSQGAGWDSVSANGAQNNNMWAYVGSDGNPFASFVNTDWIQIPFRVKIRAGEIETIGGGSGSGLVQRSVNYPYGTSGDTKGTMALDPYGNVYVCTADYNFSSETIEYTVVASEGYNKDQSINGTDMVLTILKGSNTDVDNIMGMLSLPSTAWQINQNAATDGSTWDCVAEEKDSTHWSFTWQYHAGNDNTSFSQDDEFAIFYTAPNTTAIWTQSSLGSLFASGDLISSRQDMIGGESLAVLGNNNLDLYVQSARDHSFAEVWLHNNDTSAPHVDINVSASGVDWNNAARMKTWAFRADGGLTFPDNTTQTTAYTGQSSSSSGELYIFVNADGTVITSTDGITWGQPQPSGVPGVTNGPFTSAIGKVEVHGGTIVYTRADIGVDTFPPMTGLYYSTVIGTATLCTGTDALLGDDLYWNEVHYFNATARWVAVGYAIPAEGAQYPVVAHSLNGISWTVVKPNNTFLSTYLDGFSGQFTDVVYNTVASQYVISAVRTTQGPASGGMFVTSDITVALNGDNWVDINTNIWRLGYWPYPFFGNSGYIFAVNNGETNFELWAGSPNYNNGNGLIDSNNWSNSNGWYEGTMTDNLGYVPDVSEVAFSNNVFIITTADGQVFVQPNAPVTFVKVPLAYTSPIHDIIRNAPSDGLPTTIAVSSGETPASDGEKIVISGVNSATENGSTTEQSYNGTFYIKNNGGSLELYTDQALTQPWDTSTYWPVVQDTGTLTWSHGQFLDAAGAANETLFVGNDDEQVFRSTDYGTTWTQMADVTGNYFNDFAYGTFGSGVTLNELVNGSFTVTLDADGNLELPANSGAPQFGCIQTLNGHPTLLAYGGESGHGGPELDWMNSDNPTADFLSDTTLRHTMYLNDSNGLYVGMNENQVPGHYSGNWRFNTDGTLELPAESTVGSFVNVTSNSSYNEWLVASVTAPNGTVYAVGGEGNTGDYYIMAQTSNSTLWRKSFNGSIDFGDGAGSHQPTGMNIKFDVANNLVFVGFDSGNSTGVVSLNPNNGAQVDSWVIRGGTDGNQTVSQKSFEIKNDGTPIIVGHAFGGYIPYAGIAGTKGTDNLGNDYIQVALGDIGNPGEMYRWWGNRWQIDVDGASSWFEPTDFDSWKAIPVQFTGGTGRGVQTAIEGSAYSAGGLTGSNGVGIDLDVSKWTDTASMAALLAYTNGTHFTVVIGSLTPGVDQTVLTFSSISDWAEISPGMYHMDGNYSVVSGTGNMDTAATDIMSLAYGTTMTVDIGVSIGSNWDLGYRSFTDYGIRVFGTGYQEGDTVTVKGSLIGGVDGGYILTATPNGVNTDSGSLFFAIADYPTLNVDIPAGTLFRFNGKNNLNQTVVSVEDNNAGSWLVTVTGGYVVQNNTAIDFFAGNDVILTYRSAWGGYLDLFAGLPSETVRFPMSQTITSQTTYNVRAQEGQQAFVWTPTWSHTYGTTNAYEEFQDVAYDPVNNTVFLVGEFNQNNITPDQLVMALNANNGNTLWQKYVGDNNIGNYGYAGSIDVDADGNVITIGGNDDSQAMITKLNGVTGAAMWQTVQTNQSNWNNQPLGKVDSNGDVYFGNTYYNNNAGHYILGLIKLNGSDGSLAWARNIDNLQGRWMYDMYDTFQQTINVEGGQVQWAGYVYDINNDWYDAVSVSLPQNGTGIGSHGRWIVTEDTNITLIVNNDSYVLTNPTPYVPTDNLTFTLTNPTISFYDTSGATITRNDIRLGGGQIIFPDGSDITQAGISRALKDTGDNTTYLDFTHNGKFLYFNGNNGGSTIRVPQNFDQQLPIGYTVTIVIDNFNTSSVLVNTGNDTSNGLHISAVGFSQGYSNNNWWRLGGDGNTGIYSLMKVDSNRWVLSGPSIIDDF